MVCSGGLGPSVFRGFMKRPAVIDGRYGFTVLRANHPMLVRSCDERCEQRMRCKRFRLEFRMELAAQKPRMIREFHDLDEVLVERNSGDDQTVVREVFLECSIEFIAMT